VNEGIMYAFKYGDKEQNVIRRPALLCSESPALYLRLEDSSDASTKTRIKVIPTPTRADDYDFSVKTVNLHRSIESWW